MTNNISGRGREAAGERAERAGREIISEKEPWQEMRMEDEGRLIAHYEEAGRLSDRAREVIGRVLTQEADSQMLGFARGWFNDHRAELEERGYQVRSDSGEMSESYILRTTREAGGFEELKREGSDYAETNAELENLYALKTDLKNQNVPLESQFLILNRLNGRYREKFAAYEGLARGPEKEALAKELEELFGVRQEVYEKMSGQDARKSAEAKVEEEIGISLPPKEQYIQEAMMARASRLRRIVKGGELRQLYGKEWDEEKEKMVREKIEGRVEDYAAMSPETIGAAYSRVKERLVTDYLENGLKKNPKTREELSAIQQEFSGLGRDPRDFIKAILQREGLADLSGDWVNDQGIIESFLTDWDMAVPREVLERAEANLERAGKFYQRAMRKKKGFIGWLFELLANAFLLEQERRQQAAVRQRPAGQPPTRPVVTPGQPRQAPPGQPRPPARGT